jgi:hypothetical protein
MRLLDPQPIETLTKRYDGGRITRPYVFIECAYYVDKDYGHYEMYTRKERRVGVFHESQIPKDCERLWWSYTATTKGGEDDS